jgi:iron only hydrogenase large subunit-like protein
MSVTPETVNCATDCVNGCLLGDQCPNQEYRQQAAEFIQNTSLDDMITMADEAVRRRMLERMSEPPKWIIPD